MINSAEAVITKSLSRNPVRCNLCGVHFHLPYVTNDLALRHAVFDVHIFPMFSCFVVTIVIDRLTRL